MSVPDRMTVLDRRLRGVITAQGLLNILCRVGRVPILRSPRLGRKRVLNCRTAVVTFVRHCCLECQR